MKSREQLEKSITALEAQRHLLGDAVVDAALAALREEIKELEAAEVRAVQEERRRAVMVVIHYDHDSHLPTAPIFENHGRVFGVYEGRVHSIFDIEEDEAAAILAACAVSLELLARFEIRAVIDLIRYYGTTEAAIMARLDSRIDELPAPGVALTEAAYAVVRGHYDMIELPKADLYYIDEIKPRSFQLGRPQLEAISSRMIGRQQELDRLQDIFARVQGEKRAHLVTITGMAGVGKSRLLFEFEKWMELLPQLIWYLEGNGAVYGPGTTFGLIRDMLAFRFEISEYDKEESARQKLISGVQEIMQIQGEEPAHIIGHLVGLNFSTSPYLVGVRGDSSLFRDVAYETMVKLFRSAYHTYGQPMLIRLEDIHLADRDSLDLLNHLVKACADIPLAVVATAQPSIFDRAATWGGPSHQSLIELRSLSGQDSARFLNEIFGAHRQHIPQNLHDTIINNTGGNPYHMEEVIRLLLDEAILIRGADHWMLNHEDLDTLHIPASISEVLQARINSLPPPERITLQQAAVVGVIFWDAALAHLQNENQYETVDIGQALRALQKRGMIVPRPRSSFTGAAEYAFQQRFLHQVAYDSLRHTLRQRYHLQLAQWYIGRGTENVGENASTIAAHYARAADIHRAIKWYGLAARQAFDAYLPERASRYYELAFDLMPDHFEDLQLQIQLYEGYGQVLEALSQFDEAISAYTALCIAAEADHDLHAQAQGWSAIAHLFILESKGLDAIEAAEKAYLIGEKMGEAGIEARIHAIITTSEAHGVLGDARSALAALAGVDNLATPASMPSTYVQYLSQIANCHMALNNFSQGEIALKKALDITTDYGLEGKRAAILSGLGFVLWAQGDIEGAITYLDEALHLAREANQRNAVIEYTSNLGGMLATHGRYGEAELHLRRVLRMVGDQGWWGIVGTYIALSRSLLGQGQYRAAEEAARSALQWAMRSTHPFDFAAVWRELGHVAIQKKRPLVIDGREWDAAACFEQSLRYVDDFPLQRALTLRSYGQYLEAHDPARAADYLAQAEQLFSDLGLSADVE